MGDAKSKRRPRFPQDSAGDKARWRTSVSTITSYSVPSIARDRLRGPGAVGFIDTWGEPSAAWADLPWARAGWRITSISFSDFGQRTDSATWSGRSKRPPPGGCRTRSGWSHSSGKRAMRLSPWIGAEFLLCNGTSPTRSSIIGYVSFARNLLPRSTSAESHSTRNTSTKPNSLAPLRGACRTLPLGPRFDARTPAKSPEPFGFHLPWCFDDPIATTEWARTEPVRRWTSLRRTSSEPVCRGASRRRATLNGG